METIREFIYRIRRKIRPLHSPSEDMARQMDYLGGVFVRGFKKGLRRGKRQMRKEQKRQRKLEKGGHK